MRRRGLGLVAALIVGAGTLAASPVQARNPTVVLDYDNGQVLGAVDAQVPWYPASVTKLMTIYLTFEEIAAGRLALDTKLTASEHAAAQPGTRLGLTKGATLTVDEAIHATILRSANDAAVTLAERIGGSEPEFAARMTARARTLGMTATVFKNASGLTDPQQFTTAADMAVLATALLRDFPDRYAVFGARTMTWKNHPLSNINGLLASFPGADGFKTGFTCNSGYNIVASARHEGRRLIAVVLGATSLDARLGEVTGLLKAGFAGKLKSDPKAEPAATLTPAAASAGTLTPAGTGNVKPPVIKAVLPAGCSSEVSLPSAAANPLTGWAFSVGNAHQERDARAMLDNAKRALGGDLRGGRPMVVHRLVGALPPYRALIVGFDETRAIATCLRLRRQDVHCIVLNPEQLGSKTAIWN
ncbi:MAG: D-alanyl-D-alanine carboxypeptidase [Alphaproteobacteria bacterium]|nr:D-alanyl-D-alanine carboxypeptidase [Alphaproteobacteria bacterium]